MSQKLKAVGALLGIIVALGIYAIIGAISTGTTALIIAGGLYLLGFVAQGTAQAIGIWIVAGGTLVTMFVGVLQMLVLGAGA